MKRFRLCFIALACILSMAAMAALSCCNEPDTLKVISYNIRLGAANDGENSWENRRPATIAMLKEQDPEVFGLQEALGRQVRYITEELPKYKNV